MCVCVGGGGTVGDCFLVACAIFFFFFFFEQGGRVHMYGYIFVPSHKVHPRVNVGVCVGGKE